MMSRHRARSAPYLALALLTGIILACSIGSPAAEDDMGTASLSAPGEAERPAPKATPTQPESFPLTLVATSEAQNPIAASTRFEQSGWSYAVYAWRGDEVYFSLTILRCLKSPTHPLDLDKPRSG